jgi:nucleoside-diphosphate-sugar epimerase
VKILYIGGTGQISFDCVHESVRAGHDVYVFNRGHHNAGLPDATRIIAGDMNDQAAYHALGEHHFDVVCQFRAFDQPDILRDLDVFAGRCGRYVLISSASAYQKPMTRHVITEDVPLDNPFWPYSQAKIRAEAALTGQDRLAFTIVRPSHTSRTKWTTAFGNGDVWAMRMLEGKPVLVPGDGTNLWTITRSEDFAPPFVKLLTADAALGEAYHLTSDKAYMWDAIYRAIAGALGVNEPDLVHVPTDTLIRYEPAWEGPLRGDKAYSVVFDNSKIKCVVGEFDCPATLDTFASKSAAAFEQRQDEVKRKPEDEALIDRIAAEQRALGKT